MQPFKKNKLRAPALPSPCLLHRVLASDLVSGLHAPSSFPTLIQPPAGLAHICHWQGSPALVGTVTRASLPRPRLTTAELHSPPAGHLPHSCASAPEQSSAHCVILLAPPTFLITPHTSAPKPPLL